MRKLLGVPWYLFLVTGVLASTVITGAVIAEMTMPKKIDISQRKIGEEVTYTLGILDETLTDSFNLSTICVGKDTLTIKVGKPIGSDTPSVLDLNLNGTTVINPLGKKLESGNLTLRFRGEKQGEFSCVIEPIANNVTIFHWEETL